MKDVFPKKTNEFVDFVRRFVKGVAESAGDYNFSPEEIAAMEQEFSDITIAERELLEQKMRAKAQKERRDALVKTARKNYRRRIKLARAGENVTGEKLAKIGLQPLDPHLTRLDAPAAAPVLMVLNDVRLRHTLKFWEAGSPRQRRKPAGVIGAEVWRKIIGTDEDLILIGLATRSPHSIKFEPEHIGKQVEYEIAWLNRLGERSELSQRVSATVTG